MNASNATGLYVHLKTVKMVNFMLDLFYHKKKIQHIKKGDLKTAFSNVQLYYLHLKIKNKKMKYLVRITEGKNLLF